MTSLFFHGSFSSVLIIGLIGGTVISLIFIIVILIFTLKSHYYKFEFKSFNSQKKTMHSILYLLILIMVTPIVFYLGALLITGLSTLFA